MTPGFTRQMWHRTLAILLSALFFATVAPSTLLAQIGGEGAIEGRVVDPSGAVIPNATVTAIDNATGVTDTRTASSTGDYVISPLPAGTYTVRASAKGFSTLVQQHIVVNATSATGLDLHLKVGAASQTITVSTAPPALDTTDATLGMTMENKQYSALPLTMNGQQRDPTAFIYLMPGVQSGGRSGEFNGMGSDNGYLDEMYVDGIPLTTIDQQGDNRTVSLAVSVDAVNQFQVITSSAPVEFQGMGAQNYVIKSGGNKFHGAISDYVRNTAFDSWNFFAKDSTVQTPSGGQVLAPKPPEHQNEFTATLGGPIRRNKMFFFVSYDKFHYTKYENPGLLTVPTMAMRAGDFSAYPYPIYDPTTRAACTAANGGTPCAYQFDGTLNGVPTLNVIPSSEISSISKYMEQFLPTPSNNNLTSNYFTHVPTGDNNWEFTGRLDWNISPKQKISLITNDGERAFIGLDLGADQILPLPYSNGGLVSELTSTAIVQDTYVANSHLINQLKYGYVRQWGPLSNGTYGNPKWEAASGVGIGNLPPGQASETFPGVQFNGGVDDPTRWYDQDGYNQSVNTYTLMDNVQWLHGRNSFTFGADFQWLNENESDFSTPSQPLTLSESNAETAGYVAGTLQTSNTGSPFASFLIGAVDSSGVIVQPFTTLGARYKAFSPYAEDDIRVNAKLTVNLGLRWDFYPPYHEVQNRWSFMNPDLINPATDSYGAIEFAGTGPGSCNCKTPVHYYFGNAAPRVGFAYAVDSKTVVRGGFGINYSHGGGVGGRLGANDGTGQTGFVSSPAFASTDGGGVPAFYLNPNLGAYSNSALPAYSLTPDHSPTTNAGNYVNSSVSSVTPAGVSYADPYVGGRAPYAENFNFGVQRAITNTLTLSVNYAGSQSHFLTSSLNGRGYYTNQLNPKYLVLGQHILTDGPASSVDGKTGMTFLQEAQAIIPGIQLPYADFGGQQATVEAALQPFPQYGGITDTWGNISNANYNSLQLSLSQRTWHRLDYTLNYTWSKEIDDAGDFRTGYAIPASVMANGTSWPQDRIDRSLGAGEVPQALNFYGVYSLPFGKGAIGTNNRAVRTLAGGWGLSWIATYSSGTPLEINSSGCTAPGQATCFPNYAAGFSGSPRINGGWGHGILKSTAGSTPFINGAAFGTPTQYQIGDVSRTAPYGLFGPGGYEIDAGLRRRFPIKDQMNFVFEAEAFNVMNNVNFGGVNTNTSDSNFGTVSSQTNTSRDWQFSGKLNF